MILRLSRWQRKQLSPGSAAKALRSRTALRGLSHESVAEPVAADHRSTRLRGASKRRYGVATADTRSVGALRQ